MFHHYSISPTDDNFDFLQRQKLYHRKSKFGCKRCRARRIKCNEVKPSCHKCSKNQVECVYDRVNRSVSSDNDTVSESDSVLPSNADSNPSTPDPPESRNRRLTEMRLLLHYASKTAHTFRLDDMSPPENTPLAVRSDALLYVIVSIAALHSSLTCQDTTQSLADKQLYMTYLSMAIREHRKDITKLGIDNTESVVLSSHKLRMCSLAALQYRSRQPYSPPIDFLRSGAVGKVYAQLGAQMDGSNVNLFYKLLHSSPIILDTKERYHPRYCRGLEHLLDNHIQGQVMEDTSDTQIQETYQMTVSYIGGILAAIESGEPAGQIIRRLVIFPMMIPSHFITLVEAHQPRTLVILAYYFALLYSQGRGYWWIGKSGAEEIYAIDHELAGGPWQQMLRWPLDHIEQITNRTS